MKRGLVVLAVLIVASFLFIGCEEAGNSVPTDGKVTVTYKGDGTYETGTVTNAGPLIAAVVAQGDEPGTDPNLAVNVTAIDSNGDASMTLMVADSSGGPTTTEWTGTGGTTYDVYIFIDIDDSGDPTSGDEIYKTFDPSVQYTQNGDKTISTLMGDYNTFP